MTFDINKLARYAREPLWAFRSADLRTAGVLLAHTARHHVANWRHRPRDDATFTARLDLGGEVPSEVTLRAVGGDLTILYEVFAEQSYRIPDDALPPDSVRWVADCGAHIGLSALYFAARYRHARVIAVEPNPTNHALLVANTRHEPRIIAVQACVSATSGTTTIGIEGPGWSHQMGAAGSASVEVPALTLDDLRNRFRMDTIDLLKMDIEGAEAEVLAGGVRNVRAMAAELHGAYGVDEYARDVAPLRVVRRPGHDPVLALP